MLSKITFALFCVVALLAFFGVTWLALPSSSMIAPEKTGEIGFMGVVVVAKYAGYTVRAAVAVALGCASFAGCMFLGIAAAEAIPGRRGRVR